MISVNQLIRVVYISERDESLGPAELDALLDKSRKKNSQESITGLILSRHGFFLQVIEGPKNAVNGLVEEIGKDNRHHSFKILLNKSISARKFGDWSMKLNVVDEDTKLEFADHLDEILSGEITSRENDSLEKFLERVRQYTYS